MIERFLRDLQGSLVTQLAIGITAAVIAAGVVYAFFYPRMFLLMVKNLRRNVLRTGLTILATGVLVFMVIMIWTILSFIENTTEEKSADFKLIITERWQIPSRMPPAYAQVLSPAALSSDLSYQTNPDGSLRRNPNFLFDKYEDTKGKFTEKDFMFWSFYIGSTEQELKKLSPSNIAFFFVMNPEQIKPMMDELGDLDDEIVRQLQAHPNGCLLGTDKIKELGREVGDELNLYCNIAVGYQGIHLNLKIVGVLPGARYGNAGIMNFRYLQQKLDEYAQVNKRPHPESARCMNLFWMRVKDKEMFSRVQQILEEESEDVSNPKVRCETEAAGIGGFLDAYRDIFNGVKYLLIPAVLASMALIIANAISISVRERRTEMAVLKVLGYRPNQILYLILGESILVGALSGLAAALLAFLAFNLTGGIQFPVAFFPAFDVPISALFWGPAMGALTAFLGSISPSYTARSVKVSEVFSKVA